MFRELAKAYIYDTYQWTFFFMIFCFIGWVWEVFYVSLIKNKPPKLVNRGFMKGPFLPIYGCGALTILILTLPLKPYPVLVFIFGVVGPTILEYITGALMEYLFRVRYWDYSNQFLNVKGYICLKSSVFWGFISCVLIYLIQPSLEKFVLSISPRILHPFVTFVGIIMIIDFSTSFETALQLRSVLESLEKHREEFIRKVADIDNRRHKAIVKLLERNPGAVSNVHAEALYKYKDMFIYNVSQTIEAGMKRIQEETEEAKEEAREIIEKVKEESAETLEKIKEESVETIEKIKTKMPK